MPGGAHDVRERISAVDGHNARAQLVRRRVQGDRERNWDAFVREPFDARHDARGRERHAPIAEPQNIVLMQQTQCADNVVVVFERLARAHDDDGIDARPLLPEKISDADRLRRDLPARQIAHEPVQCRGAERAAHRAARLRGDADRVPVRMPHEHRLRRLPVGERIEELDRRAVRRVQAVHDRRALDGKVFRKLGAQRFRQARYRIKRNRPAPIDPLCDLRGTEAGYAERRERGAQLLHRHSKDVHSRFIRAMKNPSPPSSVGKICTMASSVCCTGRNAPALSRTNSGCSSKKRCTTPSFSAVSIVQVL